MKRVRYALVAMCMMSSLWIAVPAQATECTPKGCTGGCHVNPPVVHENGTVTIDDLIECYS